MITKINDFSEFILIQPTLIIEIKKYIENIISNNFDIPQKVELSSIDIINDFIKNLELNEQFESGKILLTSVLKAIKAIKTENIYNLNVNQAQTFFINICIELNLFSLLLYAIQDKVANLILQEFSEIYFQYTVMDQQNLVKKINNFLNSLSFNLKDNEFFQSLYVLLLRILISKNAILINESLTNRINNLITNEGIKQAFIEIYD